MNTINLNLANSFKEIAIKITENDINNEYLAFDSNHTPIKCEDQFLAQLEINISRLGEGKIEWQTPMLDIKNRTLADFIESQNNIPTIALILESPHLHEYFDGKNKRKTPMPAMGTTGNNIVEYLPDVLMKYILQKRTPCGVVTKSSRDIENGTYRIILINAIQYQCSLGYATEKYRDNVLGKCLNDTCFKDDLIARLSKYPPQIIINCCTKGSENFQNVIQQELNKKFRCLRLIGYHPSYPSFLLGFEKEQ